jgi:hypothetical protein
MVAHADAGVRCYSARRRQRITGFLSSPTSLDVPVSPGSSGPASRKADMNVPESAL